MNILLCPNAFKGSLTALEIAEAAAVGFKKSSIHFNCQVAPIADGGDGTMEVLVSHFDGVVKKLNVHDPLGRVIEADYGLIEYGKTAVVEFASASGIKHLTEEELNPMIATSYGTGQLIQDAVKKGASHVIITLGGSATVDGATGILSAIGFDFLDHYGNVLDATQESILGKIHKVVDRREKEFRRVRYTVLCDVENTLLGDKGAAAVFGPQKGASPRMVRQLEDQLSSLAQLMSVFTGINVNEVVGGGAAGGAAAFLCALLDAEMEKGSAYLLTKTGFYEKLASADLVLTAEGRIDEQTKYGKGPYEVARLAKERSIPVVALSGQVDASLETHSFDYFDAILPITSGPMTLEKALELSGDNIERTCTQIGNILLLNR